MRLSRKKSQVGSRSLTEREQQILKLLAEDFRMINIAAILDLSEQTIKNHLRIARRSAGVYTNTGLVALAFRKGWLE